MTLHLSYEIIFHVGGLKLAVIDIASSLLKVSQFFLDNRKIVFLCPALVLQKDPWFPVWENTDVFVDGDIFNTGPDVEKYC